MYGLLYSLKSMCQKLSPTDSSGTFNCYKTNKYKLNYFETPSGLWFVVNTDVNATGMRELMQQLYQQVRNEVASTLRLHPFDDEGIAMLGMVINSVIFAQRALVDFVVRVGMQGTVVTRYSIALWQARSLEKLFSTPYLNLSQLKQAAQIRREFVACQISERFNSRLFFQVYVEYVVKNPECERGKPIESALFKQEVDEFLRRAPQFR